MSTVGKKAFDDVRALNNSSKELLATYGRQAVEARKIDYKDPVRKSRVKEITDLIERDVIDLKGQIDALEATHSSWGDSPKRSSHFSKALLVGGQYMEIMDNINNTAGVGAFELVALMNDENIAATEAAAAPVTPQ